MFGASALTVQNALDALPSVGAISGNVTSANNNGPSGTVLINTPNTAGLIVGENVYVNGVTGVPNASYVIGSINPGASFSLSGTSSDTASGTSGNWISGVTVTYDSSNNIYTVVFNGGAVYGSTQPLMTAAASAGTSAVVTKMVDGSYGTAVNPTVQQTVTVPSGITGTFKLQFNGNGAANTTSALSVTDSTLAADMQTALNNLAAIALQGSVVSANYVLGTGVVVTASTPPPG